MDKLTNNDSPSKTTELTNPQFFYREKKPRDMQPIAWNQTTQGHSK